MIYQSFYWILIYQIKHRGGFIIHFFSKDITSYLNPIHVARLNIEWTVIGTHNESYSLNKYPKTRLTNEMDTIEPIRSVWDDNHIGIWTVTNKMVVNKFASQKLKCLNSFCRIKPLNGISSSIPTNSPLIHSMPIFKFIDLSCIIVFLIISDIINIVLMKKPVNIPFNKLSLSFKYSRGLTLSLNLRYKIIGIININKYNDKSIINKLILADILTHHPVNSYIWIKIFQ